MNWDVCVCRKPRAVQLEKETIPMRVHTDCRRGRSLTAALFPQGLLRKSARNISGNDQRKHTQKHTHTKSWLANRCIFHTFKGARFSRGWHERDMCTLQVNKVEKASECNHPSLSSRNPPGRFNREEQCWVFLRMLQILPLHVKHLINIKWVTVNN